MRIECQQAYLSLLRGATRRMGYEMLKNVWSEEAAYSQFAKEALDRRRFYNVGAGEFRHPHWTNVDHLSEYYAANLRRSGIDLDYDLFSLTPLPIESGVAEAIYSSHTIEHVTNAAANHFLRESYRILRPGGFLRLTTPDIDLEYRAWKDDDRAYFYWVNYHPRAGGNVALDAPQWTEVERRRVNATTSQVFLHHFASAASVLHREGSHERISDAELARVFSTRPYEEALDYCTSKCPLEIQREQPGNHMNWWNWRKLSKMLTEAGFANPRRSGYGQSFCHAMRDIRLFDFNSPKTSIYVEANK